MKPSSITIDCSGLAEPVRVQLREQGVKLPGHTTASLERTRRAIIQLRASRCLSPAEAGRAEYRFAQLVGSCVQRRY